MTWTLALASFNDDLRIGTDGRFVTTTGVEEVLQRVRVALRHIEGEYWLDNTKGVPWDTEIMGAKFTGESVNAIFRRVILSVPGVTQIDSFVVAFSGATRAYELTVGISTAAGDVATLSTSIATGV